MPKYVCDFDTVRDAATKIQEAAAEMQSEIENYSKTIEQSLSGWDSIVAKVAFIIVNQRKVEAALMASAYANQLGLYIEDAANSIEALEEGFTQTKI